MRPLVTMVLLSAMLSGCLATPDAETTPPPPGHLIADSSNEGETPVWITIHLTAEGNKVLEETRPVLPGEGTQWTFDLEAAPDYSLELSFSYSPTAATQGGFHGSVDLPDGNCPGGDYLAQYQVTGIDEDGNTGGVFAGGCSSG